MRRARDLRRGRVLSVCGGSRLFRLRPLRFELVVNKCNFVDGSLRSPASVKDGCSAMVFLMDDDEMTEKRDDEVEFGEPRLR
jgi:hypothetical protein